MKNLKKRLLAVAAVVLLGTIGLTVTQEVQAGIFGSKGAIKVEPVVITDPVLGEPTEGIVIVKCVYSLASRCDRR